MLLNDVAPGDHFLQAAAHDVELDGHVTKLSDESLEIVEHVGQAVEVPRIERLAEIP